MTPAISLSNWTQLFKRQGPLLQFKKYILAACNITEISDCLPIHQSLSSFHLVTLGDGSMYKSANQLDQRMQEDFTFFFESDRCQLFQELVKEHRTKLHRFITRYIGAREDAAELTQQAFILAYEAYPTFRGQSTFSTWLHGIAMNLVRNYLSRTPSRRYEFVDDHALADLALEGPCPEESASLAQKMRLLSQAMQSLPPHMQEVLMLVAMEEMSYEEAAELLCIPVGTVRSRLSRARTMLKEKIGMEILNAQDTHEHTMLNH